MRMKVTTIEDMQAVWKRAGRNGGMKRSQLLTAKRKREIARLGGLAKAARRKGA